MNERLAQLQIRLAVLTAQSIGLSDARQAAMHTQSVYRSSIGLRTPAQLEELARQPDAHLKAAGIDRGDLNRAIKEGRLAAAIEAEQERLLAEAGPLRTLIDRITETVSTHEQWS